MMRFLKRVGNSDELRVMTRHGVFRRTYRTHNDISFHGLSRGMEWFRHVRERILHLPVTQFTTYDTSMKTFVRNF